MALSLMGVESILDPAATPRKHFLIDGKSLAGSSGDNVAA
jgi:hypothetical protein